MGRLYTVNGGLQFFTRRRSRTSESSVGGAERACDMSDYCILCLAEFVKEACLAQKPGIGSRRS